MTAFNPKLKFPSCHSEEPSDEESQTEQLPKSAGFKSAALYELATSRRMTASGFVGGRRKRLSTAETNSMLMKMLNDR